MKLYSWYAMHMTLYYMQLYIITVPHAPEAMLYDIHCMLDDVN